MKSLPVIPKNSIAATIENAYEANVKEGVINIVYGWNTINKAKKMSENTTIAIIKLKSWKK